MKFGYRGKKRETAIGGRLLLALCMVLTLTPVTVFAASSDTCPGGSTCAHAAAIGNVHYDTLQEAIDEAASGSEIVLLKNTDETEVRFKKEGTYTLNLNEKTLSTTAVNSDIIGILTPNLTLTIKNGSLTSEAEGTYGIYAYNSTPSDASIRDCANLNLTLDTVTLTSADQSLGVQGLNSNQNVTVRNSVIMTQSTGIYFPPKSGTLTIENSTITAVDNGIVVKGGEVVVNEDTKITATGTPEPNDEPYDGNTSGLGFPQTGNAIYVEGGYTVSSNSGTVARPIAVTINDGTFESENAVAIAVNYLTDTSTQGAQITGGVFSSDVEQFVAEDAASVRVTSGEESTFYVGTSETVAQRVADAVASGDTVTVKNGDVSLTGLPNNVTVQNDGTGNVTANGVEVGDRSVITHTHIWGTPTWVWEDDYSGATATFTCTGDASHTEILSAALTGETAPATCTEAGQTVYTASVEFNGETYTDTKTAVLPAAGHTLTHHERVEATCTAEGSKEYWSCSVCGKNFSDAEGTDEITETVIPLIDHTYDSGWKSDDTNHWHECACGAKADEAAHHFKWVLDREATETEAGSKYEECEDCGYQKDAVEIPATGTDTMDPSDSPRTGDNRNPLLWLLLLVLAGSGLTGTILYSRGKKVS